MKKIRPHIEWMAFFFGLILMATLNPYIEGTSFCIYELAGITFCPGDGLGHSIAFLFRGEFSEAMEANLFGPLAVLVLSLRILSIWKRMIVDKNKTNTIGVEDGKSY